MPKHPLVKASVDNLKKFFKLADEHKIQNKKAAQACGYSPAYFCTLRKKHKERGDSIFTHGLKGRPSNNRIPEADKEKIVTQYLADNDETTPVSFAYHRDNMEENYGVKVSMTSMRKILTEKGIVSPFSHKTPKTKEAHLKRFRRDHEGELVQWDATPFQWFKWCGDNDYYSLHHATDDATSKLLGAYICKNECRYGYIETRRRVFEDYGVELEDYSDRSPVFSYNPKEAADISTELQLESESGRKIPLWQSMGKELGITIHLAKSPQAKGKVERQGETIQLRICNEFKRLGIRTMEQANDYLRRKGVDYFNSHFAKNPRKDTPVWRKPPENVADILCVKEPRTADRNGIVRFQGLRFRAKGLWASRKYKGEVCVSDKEIWFVADGKRYAMELLDDVAELSATAPQVLERIISRYMFEEVHEHAA